MTAGVMLALVIVSTVFADLLQAYDMKRLGEVTDFRPGRFLAAIARKKFIVLSVFFMAVSFFSFLKLLDVAPLSFAVPASAGSIALDTVVAKLVLKEQVDWRRWLGAACVVAGVACMAFES